MERVKGIEPSSSAWEAVALPLSYTRPVPQKGWTHYSPHGDNAFPRWVQLYRPVVRQITRWKSACFRIGAIVSSPIPTITERHSLFPSSSTYYSIKQPCGYSCLPFWPDATSGLPRSVQVTELGRSCLFAGDTHVSVFAPSKQTTDHMPFWQSPVAFGSLSLTTFNSSSLTLTIQPSLAPQMSTTLIIMPSPRGERHTQKTGGYIVRALSTPPLPVTHRS